MLGVPWEGQEEGREDDPTACWAGCLVHLQKRGLSCAGEGSPWLSIVPLKPRVNPQGLSNVNIYVAYVDCCSQGLFGVAKRFYLLFQQHTTHEINLQSRELFGDGYVGWPETCIHALTGRHSCWHL